ncbi:hypothetical protein TorRG33x02_046650, partial [Trema orientale]
EGHTHTRLNDSTNVISYEAKKAHQSLQTTCRFFEKVLIQSVLRAQRGNPKIPKYPQLSLSDPKHCAPLAQHGHPSVPLLCQKRSPALYSNLHSLCALLPLR